MIERKRIRQVSLKRSLITQTLSQKQAADRGKRNSYTEVGG
jgi:hypothetical protein